MIIIKFPEFNRFDIKDREFIKEFVDRFKPLSCEYNFSNLFCWQDPCKLFFTLYQDRLLIYDNIEQCAFMPLGDKLLPKDLVKLSLDMKNIGKSPDFILAPEEYINEFPEIVDYYIINKEPDYAEYIYNVDSLCDLKGKKLSKKRNLISQFKRSCPGFEIHLLTDELKKESLWFAKKLLCKQKVHINTLDQELEALKVSLDRFDELGFEGLVILLEKKVVAFSIFSPLNKSTYDIHFEKADVNLKGATQVINHETAKYLKDKCQYLNKEQDLGLKGLRQTKMSYEPEKLIVPYTLTFHSNSGRL